MQATIRVSVTVYLKMWLHLRENFKSYNMVHRNDSKGHS